MLKVQRITCCLLVILLAFGAGAAAEDAAAAVRSINHRGYNSITPENTLPAYRLSKEKGFEYVETDISFTRDGIPVLLHDSSINRTARNADGSEIAETVEIGSITYEEALAYDFGIWKGEEYGGTKIPTFDEFLQCCIELGLHPYIELKENGDYTENQIQALVSLVEGKGLRGQVTWISFQPNYLEWVRDRDPEARLGLLVMVWFTEDGFDGLVRKAAALRTGKNDVFMDASYWTMHLLPDGMKQCVSVCRKASMPLEVWTVNDENALRSLDPYISGVTSDTLQYASFRQEKP